MLSFIGAYTITSCNSNEDYEQEYLGLDVSQNTAVTRSGSYSSSTEYNVSNSTSSLLNQIPNKPGEELVKELLTIAIKKKSRLSYKLSSGQTKSFVINDASSLSKAYSMFKYDEDGFLYNPGGSLVISDEDVLNGGATSTGNSSSNELSQSRNALLTGFPTYGLTEEEMRIAMESGCFTYEDFEFFKRQYERYKHFRQWFTYSEVASMIETGNKYDIFKKSYFIHNPNIVQWKVEGCPNVKTNGPRTYECLYDLAKKMKTGEITSDNSLIYISWGSFYDGMLCKFNEAFSYKNDLDELYAATKIEYNKNVELAGVPRYRPDNFERNKVASYFAGFLVVSTK